MVQLPDLRGALGRLLEQIPSGRVATYGALAEALGSKLASRWIGQELLHHPHDDRCSCHRVVRAGGRLGGYRSSDPAEKGVRLRAEGVAVEEGKVDLHLFGFASFLGDRPLERLRNRQQELASSVSLLSWQQIPRYVGGVDVSYQKGDSGSGAAAYVVIDTTTKEPCYWHVLRRQVDFPYISTFLTYRELPLLAQLLCEHRDQTPRPEIILVDGTGILHPRRAGIASMLGVALDVPTVGITKKRLCGRLVSAHDPLSGPLPVEWAGEILGMAVRPPTGSAKPIYVSPGHRVDVASALQMVSHVWYGRRLPEPIYWADRLSRQAANGRLPAVDIPRCRPPGSQPPRSQRGEKAG